MAIIYCDSNAVGLNDGTSWTDAYTTIQAAITAVTAGADVIHLASNHSEVISTSISGGSNIYSTAIYSVNSGTDVYEPATSPQFTCTGTEQNWFVNIAAYGIYFQADNNMAWTPNHNDEQVFYDCIIEANASGTGLYGFKPQGKSTEYSTIYRFINCEFKLPTTAGAYIYWQPYFSQTFCEGCTFSGAHTVYSLGWIYHAAGGGTQACHFTGCDLSSMVFSSAKVLQVANSEQILRIRFINCKLPASLGSGGWFNAPINNNSVIELIGCNTSNDNADNYEYHDGHDTAITTSTSIYNTAGYKGVDNRVSHKYAAAAEVSYLDPIFSMPIVAYVDSGSKTFTMELAHNYSANLTDQDIRMEITYLGTAGSPLASLVTTGPTDGAGSIADPLDTGTDLTASTAAWAGATGLTLQKLSKTVTVNKAGMYSVRLIFTCYESAKFIYIDPFVKVS